MSFGAVAPQLGTQSNYVQISPHQNLLALTEVRVVIAFCLSSKRMSRKARISILAEPADVGECDSSSLSALFVNDLCSDFSGSRIGELLGYRFEGVIPLHCASPWA